MNEKIQLNILVCIMTRLLSLTGNPEFFYYKIVWIYFIVNEKSYRL